MKAFTLQEAAAALGLPQMQAQATLADVCTDTRKIQPGSLFVCLRGERFDGHSFASQAAQLGAAALLVDHPVDADVPQLVVTDTGKALLQLAGWYRRRFQLPVVGLTGSVGKTTTKEFIALVLGAKYNTLKTQGNLNNEIGVPQMLFRLEDSHTAAVIEMGMNHFGEISRLTRAVAPTVGLITNIGVSHIENLGSRAGILQAKLEILEGMAPDAPLIVNMDNDMLRTVKLGDRPLLTFAIDDQSADFTATDIAEQGSTTTFTVHHSTFTQPVTIPTVGIHNVYNALAAMAVGYVTGVDPVAAAAALANYVPAGMRQNLVQVGGVQVIEDCYNASPDSMRAALQTLGKLPVHRRYAVLGAMLELGDYAKEAHTQVGKMAAENGIDGVLAYGADAAYIVEAAKQAGLENARLFDTKEALAQSLAQQVQPGDGVLFKGSRGMHLEDVMHTVYERWEKA
jgi:UDP-N-acetylmuramoyl-tripeptide--D-alanyl-D-alanine ligase